ncbi:hypothetical protein GCM10009848_27370 [Micromonospora lupini]
MGRFIGRVEAACVLIWSSSGCDESYLRSLAPLPRFGHGTVRVHGGDTPRLPEAADQVTRPRAKRIGGGRGANYQCGHPDGPCPARSTAPDVRFCVGARAAGLADGRPGTQSVPQLL